MMDLTYNPIRATHIKYVLKYLRELMRAELSPMEDQVVMLHCGMYTGNRPVSFKTLAELFRLEGPEHAEEIYRQAVIKTRRAIPDSRLEEWIMCYHLAHYPERSPVFRINPLMPVPVWEYPREAQPARALR